MFLNLKKTSAFKVIIATLLVIVFAVSVISCKEEAVIEKQPAGEEQIEVQNEINNNEVVIDSSENTEESKPVESEVDEEVYAPDIEGLKFEQKTKTYIAEANNPYGLEEGEIAGAYAKESLEVEGEIKSSVALYPKVIRFLQEKLFEEEGKHFFPIPFSPNGKDKIKINEVVRKIPEEWGGGIEKTLGINVPIGTVFYAPSSGEGTLIWDKKRQPFLNIIVFLDPQTDRAIGCKLSFNEVEMIAESFNQDKIESEGEEVLVEEFKVELGDPLGRITGDSTCNSLANRLDYIVYENPGEYIFDFHPNDRDNKANVSIDGLDILMKIGDDYFVTFLEETALEQNN